MSPPYQPLPDARDGYSTTYNTQQSPGDAFHRHNADPYRSIASHRIRRKPLPTYGASTAHPQMVDTGRNDLADTSVTAPLVEVQTDEVIDVESEDVPCGVTGHGQNNTVYASANVMEWLPYTLRWMYMLGLFACSLVILTIIVALHIQSVKNDGLGSDDGRSIQFFGWRFVPTLIAVMYALLWTMLLEDIKRTEPFARLSRSTGADANSSVLQEPGAWWNAMIDGFSRKKNQGSVSWTLICSATAIVIASLVISPLSSTFLVSGDVTISSDSPFTRAQLSTNSPLEYGEQIVPRFRTISNLLQNISTSAWVADNFAVLPFYPSQNSAAPLGATLGTLPEMWEADTTVYTLDLTCKPIRLSSKTVTNFTNHYVSNNQTYNSTGLGRLVSLMSDDGCSIDFGPWLGWRFSRFGGASWARPGYIASPFDDSGTLLGTLVDSIDGGALNFSKQCAGGEILLLSNAWTTDPSNTSATSPWNPDLRFVGHHCDTRYFAANVDVRVNISDSDSVVSFDRDLYNRARKEVDKDVLGIEKFEANFLNATWTRHFVSPNAASRISIGGPSAPLLAMYNFSANDALSNDSRLLDLAATVKQRYFGEAVMYELSQNDQFFRTQMVGKRISLQRRIFVAESIAYTLEVAVMMEIFLTVALYWLTRLSRRKLDLAFDPAKMSTSTRLISCNTEAQACFDSIESTDPKMMKQLLRNKHFYMNDQQLVVTEQEERSRVNHEKEPWCHRLIPQKFKNKPPAKVSNQKLRQHDWRPIVLYRRTITALVSAMLLILIVIAVLFAYSRGPGLSQKALIYTKQIDISRRRLSTLAPYSIIPTLLAVIIGLWWGAMESNLKFLQPFVAISRKPSPVANCMNLSYRSSYLIWASVKAALRKHWLLSAICTGTLATQILTIGMSALWQVDYGYHTYSMDLTRDLELRIMPNSFPSFYIRGTHAWTPSDSARYALQNLYGSTQANWLYSSIIQTSLNGPQPAWSLDGWGFVPLDLSQIITADASAQEVNVTVGTAAIQGSLECTSVQTLSNISYWLTKQDFRNSSIWDNTTVPVGLTTGYTLGCGSETGSLMLKTASSNYSACSSELYTTFFTHDNTLTCCENRTTENTYGNAVIAYWSANSDSDKNFTVKVLVGKPIGGLQMVNYAQTTYLAWAEPPRAAALNCAPYIKKANASVTVDRRSGRIRSYSILDEIKDDENAWVDHWVMHTDPQATGGQVDVNITVSHGVGFMGAILSAADLTNLVAGFEQVGSGAPRGSSENTNDTSFNFREPGLNMDFMSYSMYSQASQDIEQLLDSNKLAFYANKTFSTFFQNYVSSDVDIKNGGWAYQAIGATLPPLAISSQAANLSAVSDQPRAITATVSARIEMLHMSPAAVWLCMCLLACLIITAMLLVFLEKRYLSVMDRGVSTIADVLIMVSDRATNLQAKLGWFRGSKGHKRWGIELVGDDTAVEWLDDEPSRYKKGTLTGSKGPRVTENDCAADDAESIPMVKVQTAVAVEETTTQDPVGRR